ncbi:hypothetical protein PRK78_003821 [Emydomyces testavorans]|uniref:Calcineurin-like phosphoesterase domain-containing protein n=1 Tax=Emydomyces testavorans TaxID=2070801 RepID=A0AAF0DHH3_9EURO|nr:hypothetical protein PRK78_003821 [Emydomyces testavorans]
MAAGMNGELVKTRICMISDTHDCVPVQPEDMSTPYRRPLPSADVVLHAGDLTFIGLEREHRAMVDMLKEADAELKIVIAGNHDITLDEEYYNSCGFRKHTGREDLAKIRDLYRGEDAQNHGIVYMEEGLRKFKLKNGAQFTVYASPYQPEFCNMAFGYKRGHDRFNPSSDDAEFQAQNPVPSFPDVHIMLTHGPPKGILDIVPQGRHVGCQHLRRAVARARPLIHCFGHIHESHGAMRMNWEAESSEVILQDRNAELETRCAFVDVSRHGNNPLNFGVETLFVNAAIMTLRYHPLNAPWVVDIDLPRTSDAETHGLSPLALESQTEH